MLDVEVWKEPGNQGGTVVRHSYYEKPSTCPLVFHGRGAVATRQKIVTLAEEARRRMMNMDRQSSREERLNVLRKFSQKLEDSGYSRDVRQEIMKSGLTRYYRLVLQEIAGGRKLYRSAEEMKDGRSLKLHRSKS